MSPQPPALSATRPGVRLTLQHLWTLCAGLTLAATTGLPATGAEQSAKPLRYSRCFVPADQPKDWPYGELKYIPLEKTEFERLIEAADSAPLGRSATRGAHVTRAVYRATLAEADLLRGEARLEISLKGERAVLMSLAPLAVAISEARWDDHSSAAIGSDPAGKQAVLVDRDGALILNWSLHGRRDSGGSLVFPLELPSAEMAHLDLELPPSLVPSIADVVDVSDDNQRRAGKWQFELGGRTHVSLKADAKDSPARARRLALLQEKTTCRLSPAGADIVAQLKLDVYREPLRRLHLNLPSAVRVVSVQYGGAELPWSTSPGPSSGETTVAVDFAEPLLGPGRLITVSALAPIKIDAAWKVPRIRVRDVTWQEGDLTLLVPPTLALDALLPQGCRQTKVSPVSVAPSGESVELQLFSADATAEVQVSRHRQRGSLASGVTVRFAPDAVRAEFRGRFESAEGETFLLRAEVLPGWQIDSVTADRPGALANWSIDRSRRPATLVVQLAEPIAPLQPLQLLVTARRALVPEGRYSARLLGILDFQGLAVRRRLLALETSVNRRLTLEGIDPPHFQSRTALSDAERGLLASALSDVYLPVDTDRTDFQLVIEQQTPRYKGELYLTAEVTRRRLNESYRIRCEPDGSRVDQLLVAFSEGREGGLRFRGELGDRETIELTAERLSPEQQAARGLPNAGEVWLVRLPREIDRPFDLLATRSLDFEEAAAPALAALPEAVSQQGIVEIRCERGPPLIESADRLEPVPNGPVDEEESARLCARFRYDPLDEIAGMPAQPLVLRPMPDADVALATVWRLRLGSQYASPQESYHRAFFDLEIHGKPQCTLELPEGARFVNAYVDGKEANVSVDGSEVSVPLPFYRRFAVLTVDFASPPLPSDLVRRCVAPWPTVDLPVISRQWYVSTGSQNEPLVWPEHRRIANLFGPFQRNPGERPFDAMRLLERERDGDRDRNWRKIFSPLGGQLAAERRAERLLVALGVALSASDSPITSLGRLLTEANAMQPSVLRTLRIDAQSLAAIDVCPASPLAAKRPLAKKVGAETSTSTAAQELRSLGLALVVAGEQLLLTTRSAALDLAGKSFDDGRSLVFTRWQAPPIDTARNDSAFVPLSVWQRHPDIGWDTRFSAGLFGQGAGNQYRIDLSDLGGRPLHFFRRDVMTVGALAQAVIFAALAAWLSRRFFILVPPLAGLAAVVATWLPSVVAPLASGALVGCILGAIWRLGRPDGKRPVSRARDISSGDRSSSTARRVAVPLAGIVAVVLSAWHAHADDSRDTKRDPLPRVFIPIDEDNKPGATYYIPSDFLEELRRRARDAVAEPRGWLITGAAYRCTLAGERPVGVKEFVARYDLHVFSADARVRIPASRRQADLVFDSATLDGQPIELEWDAAGDALRCHIADPGTYELEFRLDPIVADEQEMRGFRLAVPSVAAANLDVLLPASINGVDIPAALGATLLSEDGRRLSARLGPTESIVLRWPLAAAAPAVADVEELLWLKVRPGSVVLDAKLNYNVSSGVLRQVEFAADRRLRLLPAGHTFKERTLPADASPPDATQVTQLELQRPVTDQVSLHLSFLLTGTSGVGNIRLPRLHAVNGHLARRWLAVTVDTGLEYETRDAEQLEVLPAADFAAKWGEADAAALRDALVYKLGSTETAWNLATRSREPQTTVKETLSLSAQRSGALVRYEAQLMTTAGFVFQHRLLVPPDLDIERITLEDEGVDRVTRWAPGEPGGVTLFLNRRVTGPQQLSVRGRLPLRANGRLNLPTITLDSGASGTAVERVEVLERIVHLYRQPTVRVSLEDAIGLSELTQPAADHAIPSFGRLVLSRSAERTYSGTLVVAPNAPRVQKPVQITLLRYVNQGWMVDVDYQFRAEAGVVDSVSFDLPASWAADVEVLSPPATSELAEQPGKSRKMLIVRPLRPLSGDCELKFRAPLKYRPGEPVTAPEIVPLGTSRAERYWLLPQRVGIEEVTWDLQRMVAASPPDAFAGEAEGLAVFRAVGDHPQAVMSSVKTPVGVARIRLADVRLDYAPARGWFGAAALDLEPGGQSTCRVKLAERGRLIYAAVGDSPVMPLAQGPGEWQIPLHSNRLPQRLVLTFSVDASSVPASLPLPVVQIDGWPVEETLLTVSAPKDYQVAAGAARVDSVVCDEARLASAISLVDLPVEVVATTSTDDLGAWFHPWARWLVSRNKRGALERAANDRGGASAALPDNWLRVARRLQVEELLKRIADQRPAAETMDVWQLVHGSSPATRFRWFAAKVPSELTLRRDWPGGWPSRLRQTACIGALIVVALVLPRFAALSDVLRRWPYFAGVAAGLLWWLYCQPSFLGWLLVAISLAGSLRSAFRPIAVRS